MNPEATTLSGILEVHNRPISEGIQNTVIFDLDGTLALIHKRREYAALKDNKIDWDKFIIKVRNEVPTDYMLTKDEI